MSGSVERAGGESSVSVNPSESASCVPVTCGGVPLGLTAPVPPASSVQKVWKQYYVAYSDYLRAVAVVAGSPPSSVATSSVTSSRRSRRRKKKVSVGVLEGVASGSSSGASSSVSSALRAESPPPVGGGALEREVLEAKEGLVLARGPDYGYLRVVRAACLDAVAAALGPAPTLNAVLACKEEDCESLRVLAALRVSVGEGGFWSIAAPGESKGGTFFLTLARSVRMERGWPWSSLAARCARLERGAADLSESGDWRVVGSLVRPVGPEVDGYCYLHLVREEFRAGVAAVLGSWPDTAKLAGSSATWFESRELQAGLAMSISRKGVHLGPGTGSGTEASLVLRSFGLACALPGTLGGAWSGRFSPLCLAPDVRWGGGENGKAKWPASFLSASAGRRV